MGRVGRTGVGGRGCMVVSVWLVGWEFGGSGVWGYRAGLWLSRTGRASARRLGACVETHFWPRPLGGVPWGGGGGGVRNAGPLGFGRRGVDKGR